MLLEEGSDIAESGLDLSEAGVSSGDRLKESEGLFAGSNGVSVFLDSLVVSSVLVNEGLFSRSLVVLVGGEVLLFVGKGGFFRNLLVRQIGIFRLIVSKIGFGGLELSSEGIDLIIAPASLSLDGLFVGG